MNENVKKTLLNQIRVLSFALVETNLYLDVYPNDTDALAYYRRMRDELKSKVEAYEESFGPLTAFGAIAGESWDWICGPWPWESED